MKKALILREAYKKRFHVEPLMVAAPGRINLIGEHLDYNGGLVFPASIDRYIYCAISENAGFNTEIVALDLDESLSFELHNIEKQEKGSWKNYVLGVIWGIQRMGFELGDFSLMFCGDIPVGFGLSSSAALGNSVVFALNETFHLGLRKDEMVELSVQAERIFAGVSCGAMDQFASFFGKSNQAILLDTATLQYEYVPLELGDYELLLLNSRIKHQLSDSPYNQRKEECNVGFAVLRSEYAGLDALCHANLNQLNKVKGALSRVVYRRCKYVLEENQRVKVAMTALENKKVNLFGELLFQSHQGLKDLYEVSCEELDFLVELAKEQDGVLGSRMMGGGFGGCTLNLVHRDKKREFISVASQRYKEKFGIELLSYAVNVSDGVHRYS